MTCGMSVVVICPRECPDPRTDHCVGEVRRPGVARCQFCGRFMPLAEAIDFTPDEDFVPATRGGST